MRQKRAKTYKRVMALYVQTFGFRQPFQILVSHDLLLEAGKSDLNIFKQFLQVTQGECKPMITQCCMEALYKLGKDVQRTTDIAKRFERRKCNHREALEPDACLTDVIGQTNKHRYVLATQSLTLRQTLSTIPALPIIHFNPRGVLVLSPPSTATIREKNKTEEARRLEGARALEGVVDGDNVLGASASASAGASSSAGAGAEGRKRKVKGPNPLSVRKKKAVLDVPAPKPEHAEGKKKRRRDTEDEDDGAARGQEGVNGVDGEHAQGEGEGGKKKRKRKKKKSAVAEAIAELNEQGGGEESGSE